MIDKDIMTMTKEDFFDLPKRKWDEDIGQFDSLVILPMGELHDSGWGLMDFIAVRGVEPVCRLSGVSDALDIDGIGGYGKSLNMLKNKAFRKPHAWSIDCLPCGLLRLFCNHNMTAGVAVSSFEVFAAE